MTNTSKVAKVRQRKPKGPFSDELLDQILSQLKGHDAESLLGQSGLVAQLKRQLSTHCTGVAATVGTGRSFFCISAGGEEIDLHDERD